MEPSTLRKQKVEQVAVHYPLERSASTDCLISDSGLSKNCDFTDGRPRHCKQDIAGSVLPKGSSPQGQFTHSFLRTYECLVVVQFTGLQPSYSSPVKIRVSSHG